MEPLCNVVGSFKNPKKYSRGPVENPFNPNLISQLLKSINLKDPLSLPFAPQDWTADPPDIPHSNPKDNVQQITLWEPGPNIQKCHSAETRSPESFRARLNPCRFTENQDGEDPDTRTKDPRSGLANERKLLCY